MNYYYYISSLTTIFLSIILAFFILAKGRKASNVLFCLYSLCVAGWSGAKFISWITILPQALYWTRISIAIAVFIPVVYFHFSLLFTGRRNITVWRIYSLAAGLSLLSFSNAMVSGLKEFDGIKTIIPGILYIAFLLFFSALIAAGFKNFLLGQKSGNPRLKNQLKYLLVASFIGFGGGMLVFASNLNLNLEPIGYGFIPLYSLIAAYAIVKHRLLDINVVIRKGIVYSVSTLLITSIYFLGFSVFRDYISQFTRFNALLVNLIGILVFVLLFEPLRSKTQQIVDRTFYKDKIDREKAIIAFSSQVMGIVEFNELIRFIEKNVMVVLKLRLVTIYTDDRCSGNFMDSELNELGKKHVDSFRLISETIFVSEKEILLPILFKGELLGVLHVKEKLSGDSFSLFEIELLNTFLNQAASALKNAFLLNEVIEHKQRLFNSSNLANLGTLSAGMAHEIKNPLAVIKGMSQILPEYIDDREFLTKFANMIPGQIDRINLAIEALLKIGKRSEIQKKETDINKLLKDICDFLRIPFKHKNISIQINFSVISPVMADYNMLYQAFFNIIQNAGQAMSGGGVIVLKTYPEARVEITDSGSGIARDQMDKIFSPFVTSKEGGVGLGLFMVKKILEEHNATIDLESQIGLGSCFKVDFQKG
ncbi:MAG: hypothetical protein HQ564_01075 [Candidatus Saganbacteria bacterium]|nr:hypothetical protein [Candidatus Saganbacteria bacterium]